MSVIALSHITKDYGGGHGVFDVSFAVEQGEVFGFLGPNGAGKTTTIRQLMGFLAPDSGTCTINGLDCRTQTAAIQKIWAIFRASPPCPTIYAAASSSAFWPPTAACGARAAPESFASALSWTPRAGYGACPTE